MRNTIISCLAWLMFCLTAHGWNSTCHDHDKTYTPPTDCDIASRYIHPNASSIYSIPGVDVNTATGNVTTSTAHNWTLTATLNNVVDQYNSSSFNPDVSYWLDTSTTVPVTDSATDLPYNGCVFGIIGLSPQVTKAGENDDGTCSTLLGTSCAAALQAQFKTSAHQVSSQSIASPGGPALNATEACQTLGNLLAQAPNECKSVVGGSGNGWGGLSWASITFTPTNTSNCSTLSPSNPTSIPTLLSPNAEESYSDTTTNHTGYDHLLNASVPVLMAFYSNRTTSSAAEVWSDTRLACMRPGTVAQGSRVPATSSSGGARVISTSVGRSAVWMGIVAGVMWSL
ncbi:MAG: hypothetical protein M1827_003132 [Pycnora praestabilis]|nr:MAG: hypothetical protein M1827_003132 [Pycnora praestabilis]